MARIHYKTEGGLGLTPCPFENRTVSGTPKVNSLACAHSCKYYRSTDHKNKVVICLADCSSRLEEILNKIDTVIINDESSFRDFLSEIRGEIVDILDGGNEENKEG